VSAERRERSILLLVSAVQFVNVLDFVMVVPLGPDFASALGIPVSRLGLVTGSYTLAAAAAGVAGSGFLDDERDDDADGDPCTCWCGCRRRAPWAEDECRRCRDGRHRDDE
jgi:MFS family permease